MNVTDTGTTLFAPDKPRFPTLALALVDRALQGAAGRQVCTRDEAITVMTELEASLPRIDAAVVASILHDAVASYEADLLIDREHVLNPLLDARLALARTN